MHIYRINKKIQKIPARCSHPFIFTPHVRPSVRPTNAVGDDSTLLHRQSRELFPSTTHLVPIEHVESKKIQFASAPQNAHHSCSSQCSLQSRDCSLMCVCVCCVRNDSRPKRNEKSYPHQPRLSSSFLFLIDSFSSKQSM